MDCEFYSNGGLSLIGANAGPPKLDSAEHIGVGVGRVFVGSVTIKIRSLVRTYADGQQWGHTSN